MFKGIQGAGLGLRREFIDALAEQTHVPFEFLEIAPENWITYHGSATRTLQQLSEQFALSCHGLSLSIGSPDPLDIEFVRQVKVFLDQYNIELYSEHLSFCSAGGHLYDLMPIPFTEEAVDYLSERIKRVQDIIERPLVLENISYYANLSNQLSELDFILEILSKSGAKMLLDVNNVYVNSVNHKYDPYQFIAALPSEKIVYGHIAGHYNEADDLIIDTHASAVIEPVWKLLEYAYQCHGVFPTLLERDFNIPDLDVMFKEVERISAIQAQWTPA